MTQIIKILGTGCPKCQSLLKATEEVVHENNINATVEKVDDIMKILEYHVMTTPALVVNEKILVKGRVPSKDEIFTLLQSETKTTIDQNTECCGGSDRCC
ncbi:MAG: TM0996/MTH895 family glutaredoxin-like protein [Lewinellaceae bacterium]|nr:TM0996/MTH895 family glutaredoxin-like protein [Lewinellaceae bacterium]